MKKIIRILLLLIVCSVTIDVNAAATGTYNATVSTDSSSAATSIKYRGYSESSKVFKAIKTYKSPTYWVNFGGKKYKAMCIDPGISRPSGAIRCEPATNDGSLMHIKSLLDSNDWDTVQLAARFVSIYNGYTYYQDFSDLKYALVSYLQIQNGMASHEEHMREAMIRNNLCSADNCDKQTILNNLLWGDTAMIEKAYNLSNDAREAFGNAESITTSSGFLYSATGTGKTVTVQVTSKNAAPLEGVRFECARGCTVSSQNWSGTRGVVTLQLTDNSCAYELKTIYTGQGPYLCRQNNASQTLLIYVDDGEMEDIYQGESGTCTDCCPDNPITPGHITGSVNNCCDTTHSWAKEYELDDLFCYDDRVEVEYFKKKCSIDYYREEIINNYCELFCTERVTVDTPSAITAVSGRYFQLTDNGFGHTYPHIEGFKRCRIRIEWDRWESEYGALVEKQVESYNTAQLKRSEEYIYERATPAAGETRTQHVNYTVGCTCKKHTGYEKKTDPVTNQQVDDTSKPIYSYNTGSGSKGGTVTWLRWKFPEQGPKPYQQYIIEPTKRSEYRAYEIIHDSTGESKHDPWSLYDYPAAKAAAGAIWDQAKAIAVANCSRGGYTLESCDSKDIVLMDDGLTATLENVPDVLQGIRDAITAATDSYNAAAEQAKIMEEELTVCNVYFDEVSPETLYPFHANADFSYSQTYLDDYGELKRDEIFVEKNDSPGCVITRNDGGDDIKPPRYSEKIYSKFSHDIEITEDMAARGTIEYEPTIGGIDDYLDEKYEASKKFTHDARFQAICDWDDADNTIYTLVPNGSASESTSEINYTQHDRQYRVYLSTLDGTYETFWHVSGLGTNGKFDQYFLDNGTTCAGESAADVSMFTCKLHVEYEIVLTGYCNGVTNGIENCDPYKEGYDLFNFKVVDPSDLFPSVSNPEDVDYGYNWLVEERGREVLGTIQETGRKDETYAIDNLTYAFELSPTDMQHIKAYNETRIAEGGYSDFELVCKESCNISVEYGENIGCRKCHSTFLENLASGKVVYNGADHEVIGWANSRETLGEVRNGNNW